MPIKYQRTKQRINNTNNNNNNCRKKLETKFRTEIEEISDEQGGNERKQFFQFLSNINIDNTRKFLRNSMEHLSKTVRTITQTFRVSTKRRQLLQEGPTTPNYRMPGNTNTTTPSFTLSKRILGRTPTKLYSPFGIESPFNSCSSTTTRITTSKRTTAVVCGTKNSI